MRDDKWRWGGVEGPWGGVFFFNMPPYCPLMPFHCPLSPSHCPLIPPHRPLELFHHSSTHLC